MKLQDTRYRFESTTKLKVRIDVQTFRPVRVTYLLITLVLDMDMDNLSVYFQFAKLKSILLGLLIFSGYRQDIYSVGLR